MTIFLPVQSQQNDHWQVTAIQEAAILLFFDLFKVSKITNFFDLFKVVSSHQKAAIQEAAIYALFKT